MEGCPKLNWLNTPPHAVIDSNPSVSHFGRVKLVGQLRRVSKGTRFVQSRESKDGSRQSDLSSQNEFVHCFCQNFWLDRLLHVAIHSGGHPQAFVHAEIGSQSQDWDSCTSRSDSFGRLVSVHSPHLAVHQNDVKRSEFEGHGLYPVRHDRAKTEERLRVRLDAVTR